MDVGRDEVAGVVEVVAVLLLVVARLLLRGLLGSVVAGASLIEHVGRLSQAGDGGSRCALDEARCTPKSAAK
jgi:hypothetical protein